MVFKNWLSSLKSWFSNNATTVTEETIEQQQNSSIMEKLKLEPGKINRRSKTVRILKGDSNNSIPSYAFRGYSLKSVQIEGGANITTIEQDAFRGCSSLKSINIPNTVTTIEEAAFYKCSSLRSITIPIGVKKIGGCAFCGCSSLGSIDIPNTVTTIGRHAFNDCSSLRSINIPIGVTYIGYQTFRACKLLRSIHIPNTVETVERCAFWGCSSIRSINIPIGVTTIVRSAFCDCKLLQSIHIPNTVETIGEDAFLDCDTLEQRLENGTNYHPDTATWLRQRFDNLPVHQACYYANDDAQSAVDDLSKLIQENKQALTATDAMGMTPLHILSCNPHITSEMVRVIVEREEGASTLLAQTDVTGNTPLQLFMRCGGYSPVDADEQEEEVQSMPSLCDLLEKGISGEDLSILFALNDNQQIDMSGKDEETGLFPFMSAAVLPGCGLDAVYALAMNNLDVILVSSTTQNLKRDTKKRCGCFKWI